MHIHLQLLPQLHITENAHQAITAVLVLLRRLHVQQDISKIPMDQPHVRHVLQDITVQEQLLQQFQEAELQDICVTRLRLHLLQLMEQQEQSVRQDLSVQQAQLKL